MKTSTKMSMRRKASKKQLANLAKGRAKLAKIRAYGVTHEFSRGEAHQPHASIRKNCRHCGKAHSTSQHNAHAFYGEGSHLDKLVPAFKLTHKKAKGHSTALRSLGSAIKHAIKHQ
jgi:hypothetical protein